MERVETRGPLSDATSFYDVKFRDGITVYQFINEVLGTQKERGTIEIVKGRKTELFQNGLEYSCGEITGKLGKGISEEEIGKTVLRAQAHGGWGMMDYFLWLED